GHSVTATFLGAVFLSVLGGIGVLARWLFSKLGSSTEVGPTFWSVGRKFRISALCPQYPDDSSGTGWRQEQYGRPDQWGKFIDVSSQLGLRHTVRLKDPHQRLFLMISRDCKERVKIMKFIFLWCTLC